MRNSYRKPRIKVIKKSEHEFEVYFDDETEREMEEIKSKVKHVFSVPLTEFQYRILIDSIVGYFFSYDNDMVALEDLISAVNEFLDGLIYNLHGGGTCE